MLTLYTEEHVLPNQSVTIERCVIASEVERYHALQILPMLEAEISPYFMIKHLAAAGQSSHVRYSITVVNISDKPRQFVVDLLTMAEFNAIKYGV